MWTELGRKRRERDERHESKERKQLLNFKARLTSTSDWLTDDWFFILVIFCFDSSCFSSSLPNEFMLLLDLTASGVALMKTRKWKWKRDGYSVSSSFSASLSSFSLSLSPEHSVETRNTWINEIEKGERRQFASRCHLDSWQCYIPLHGCRVCCFSFFLLSLCLSPRFDANYFMSNPGQKENRLKQESSWEKNILGRRRDRLPISCHDNRICSERHKRDRLSFQTLSLSFPLFLRLLVRLVILSSSLLYYFASLSPCVSCFCVLSSFFRPIVSSSLFPYFPCNSTVDVTVSSLKAAWISIAWVQYWNQVSMREQERWERESSRVRVIWVLIFTCIEGCAWNVCSSDWEEIVIGSWGGFASGLCLFLYLLPCPDFHYSLFPFKQKEDEDHLKD